MVSAVSKRCRILGDLVTRTTKPVKVKKAKADIDLHGNPISELRDVTCHMGSHSVTCQPTQVNASRLTPAICRLVLDLPTPEGWKAELTYRS